MVSLWIIMMAALQLDLAPESWREINDGVMGGRSDSAMAATAEGLLFAGDLSLENNGGFASARRALDADWSQARGIRLEVRGDGRSYQFRIHQDRQFDGVSWRHPFSAGTRWQVVELWFEDFEPVFRGRLVPEAGSVEPVRIRQIGVLLADKQAGPFALEIRRIEALTKRPAPD